MFFTAELLERRDSGFGLLWLAATLGAKSSFKKLPKRSVLTADISQLCDLIAEPAEPLALRLSSNLMIGVARVYKVKQEIFFGDVTTCYNSLRRAMQELGGLAQGGDMQMGQPSLRADVLTVTVDPATAFSVDFGNLFADWDDLTQKEMGVDQSREDEEESDEEFDPVSKKRKKKQAVREKPVSAIEGARAMHTLEEHHEHFLSASLDASLTKDPGGVGPSSSQFDGGFDPGFGFSDDVFGLPEGLDLAPEIGDELAKELGWGGSPDKWRADDAIVEAGGGDFHMDIDLDGPQLFGDEAGIMADAGDGRDPLGDVVVSLGPHSPIRTVEQDAQLNGAEGDQAAAQVTRRRAKRVRLLLDARTELTDDELKAARANYEESQETLRREINQKKLEKESGRLIEEMIWGVPQGLQAPVLVDFWLENFKLQVKARSGGLHLETSGEPPTKRRRINGQEQIEGVGPDDNGYMLGAETRGDWDMAEPFMGGEAYADFQDFQGQGELEAISRMRSSEDPEQARRGSKPPSFVGGSHLGLGVGGGEDIISGSQRSVLFPWDNAGGASSSVAWGAFDMGRGSSVRLSSISRGGLRRHSVPDSPLPTGRVLSSPGIGDDGAFGNDLEFPGLGDDPNESQQSENLATLERSSHHFLEYAKMQLNAFPSATSSLAFDDVVPKDSSTRRVAAAGFYHCLVLATRDLISVSQKGSYGTLKITVK